MNLLCLYNEIVRRRLRIFANTIILLSLLLCLAISFLCVRSFWVDEEIDFYWDSRPSDLNSAWTDSQTLEIRRWAGRTQIFRTGTLLSSPDCPMWDFRKVTGPHLHADSSWVFEFKPRQAEWYTWCISMPDYAPIIATALAPMVWLVKRHRRQRQPQQP